MKDRPRSPSRPAKGCAKTKDKDRDASPTMGGTIDLVSDDDDTVDRSKDPLKARSLRRDEARAAGRP